MRTAMLLLALAVLAPPAPGYIHVPPKTLKQMCEDSGRVRLLTVKARDKDRGAVVFGVDEVIRSTGKSGVSSFRLLVRPDARGGKAVLDKLEAGKAAVLFTIESEGRTARAFGYAFIDEDAFSVDYNAEGEFWLFLRHEPGLSVTYHGAAKDLPPLVKAVLKGKEVKAPTKAPAKEDHARRAFLIDEALRRNRPTYPKGPLPTAWGKPARGLQAGVRVNPAVKIPGAVAALEVVVRNVGDEPVLFSHLQLGFGGKAVDGSVTAKGVEEVGGKGFSPKGTRLVVIVSPGDSYALATLSAFRPGEGKGWPRPGLQLRLGENRVGAEGVAVRLGDTRDGENVELVTGYLDVTVPPSVK